MMNTHLLSPGYSPEAGSDETQITVYLPVPSVVGNSAKCVESEVWDSCSHPMPGDVVRERRDYFSFRIVSPRTSCDATFTALC